jgi:hypothetical protein
MFKHRLPNLNKDSFPPGSGSGISKLASDVSIGKTVSIVAPTATTAVTTGVVPPPPPSAPSTPSVINPLIPMAWPSTSTLLGFLAFLTLFGGGLTFLIIMLVRNKKKRYNVPFKPNPLPTSLMAPIQLTVDPSSVEQVETKVINEIEKPLEDDEKPTDPEPVLVRKEKKMFPDIKDSEDSFAKQYSYENIHDSMFNRPKTKPSFSKLGGTSDNWESDVAVIRGEIEASGQTLEQFMDTTMAPIPEALADAWKASKYLPKRRYEINDSIPKYAQKEMPQLVSDATQSIPLDGKDIAYTAMEEILKAKKRAKVLGVDLPKYSSTQISAIEKWASSDEKSLQTLATSLKTMN